MTIRERFKEKHPRIYARILECQKEQDNEPNDKLELTNGEYSGNFKWSRSKEGQDFWQTINNDTTEKYQIFYDKYSEEEVTKNVEKTEFKEGDFIVMLEGDFSMTDCGKTNYCFKQRNNKTYINPEKDLNDSSTNGNTSLTFNKSHKLTNWRYATEQEVTEYQRINKPYDVTTLTKVETIEKWSVGSYVVALRDGARCIPWKKGDIAIFTKKEDTVKLLKNNSDGWSCSAEVDVKWFATRQEAEEFAKTLTKEVVEKKVEIMIFGKYKIGDIVVSLSSNDYRATGELFKVLPNPNNKYDTENLYYESSTCSSAISEWRIATQEEKEAFEKGIKNINDIKVDKVSKVEYEVGKWYKVEEHSFFGKFLKISKEGRFETTERSMNGKSNDYSESHYPFEALYTWIPATIEELHNFLPEGHIDRQENEDCEDCNGTGEVMIAKLYPNGHTEVSETCPSCNGEGFLETKTKTMEEEFKNGDWVVTNRFNTGDSKELKVVQILKDESKHWNFDYCYVTSNRNNPFDNVSTENVYNLYGDTLRKALPHEIPTNTESKTLTIKEEAEKALQHLLDLGFKKDCKYDSVTGVKNLIADKEPRICCSYSDSCYIDCGNSYLWKYENKDKFATLITESKVEKSITMNEDDELKVGDRVQCVEEYKSSYTIHVGMTGTYLGISKYNSLSVKWDNFTDGHSLDGLLERNDKNKGYYVGKENVKKISNTNKEYPLTPQESVFSVKQIEEQVKKITKSSFSTLHEMSVEQLNSLSEKVISNLKNNQTTNNKVLLLPTKEIYVRKSKNN
jgi:hypothetical protein